MLNFDFSDVKIQDSMDSKSQLVPINYDPDYSNLISIFRPLCIAQEYSLRVLHLTTEILEFNPSHYSIWKYRKDILLKLNDIKLWNDELIFLNQIGAENPKSYQIW